MLYIPSEDDRWPKAGVLATEIADVADNARHEGVILRRRILRIRRMGEFSNPEMETPPDALAWFAKRLVLVAFRCLTAAHHAARRAAGFKNEHVIEIGGMRDQLGSFILTQEAKAGVDIEKNPPIPMPWEPYKPGNVIDV